MVNGGKTQEDVSNFVWRSASDRPTRPSIASARTLTAGRQTTWFNSLASGYYWDAYLSSLAPLFMKDLLTCPAQSLTRSPKGTLFCFSKKRKFSKSSEGEALITVSVMPLIHIFGPEMPTWTIHSPGGWHRNFLFQMSCPWVQNQVRIALVPSIQ